MAGTATSKGVPRQITQGRHQVPVLEANAIPRIQFSSGAARGLEAFSRDMFSLSNGFQDQLDQQAEAEGTVDGAMAGLNGEPELQDYGTIRGRAFNRAAVESFVTTMETSQILKVQELSAKFGEDPARLQAELDAYGQGASKEVEKLYPPAAAGLRQRLTVRAMPAVEAAKDARYKRTREEADAAIIANEVAMRAEITSLAEDLFSDNPARSAAASNAVGALQDDFLKIFEAVDPTTNRPLYDVKEKAKAKAEFYERVVESAALGWFDSQPDKAGAYMKFTEGEFKVNLGSPAPDKKRVIQAQGSVAAKRKLPLKPVLVDQLAAAAAATGDGIQVKVHSGGQPTAAEVLAARRKGKILQRTGSVRHDHGGAGDLVLLVNGREVTPKEDRGLYLKFAENAAAAGATGIGIDDDWIHVGGGNEAAWGYRGGKGKGEFLPPDFASAIERGRRGPKIETKQVDNQIDIRKALPAGVLKGIEEEMRARINFSNSLRDRDERLQDKAIKADQELNEFDLTERIFRSDGGVTAEEIRKAVSIGDISPSKGEAIVRALATERPEKSDEATFRDLQRRVYAGEDIYGLILDKGDKLSSADAGKLLGLNQSLVRATAGDMTDDQKFHFSRLEDLLTPDGLMAKIDDGAEDRKYLALDEYRRRVIEDGEDPRQVSYELRERSTLDMESLTSTALDRFIKPRFSVRDPANPQFLDVQASGKALIAKRATMKPEEFQRQVRALKEFAELQATIISKTKPSGAKK